MYIHPNQQIKTASEIIQSVEKGENIIVGSHSFDMIEALYNFSQKSEIKDRTNFYFLDEKELKDVTNDVGIIHEDLLKAGKTLTL